MKESRRTQGQAGFTLIEILVALILIALLVTAVFPVVTQQVGSASAPRMANDLSSLRTGMELFNANVRRYPASVDQLIAPLAVSAAPLEGGTFGQAPARRWDGPYVDVTKAAGLPLATPYDNVTIANGFVLFNATANSVAPTAADANYTAVRIEGLTEDQFLRLNDIIDGDADAMVNDGTTAGRLRSIADADPAFSEVYYLAVPFRR